MVKQSTRRADGFALLECLFAMLVLTILATTLLAGERNGDLVARRVLEESLVSQQLESRIEELRAAPSLVVGEHEFTVAQEVLALGTDHGRERITALENGLFEVEVSLSWKPLGGTSPLQRSLTTRIARRS